MVCSFMIAVAFLVIGVVLCIVAHYGWKRLALLACVVLADLSILLPISTLEVEQSPVSGVFQDFYNLFAMLLFESRIDEFLEAVNELGFGTAYFVLIQILYILTFVLFASLAYSLVTRRLASLFLIVKIGWFFHFHKEGRVYAFNGFDSRCRVFVEDLFSGKKDSDGPRLCIVCGMSKDDFEKQSDLMDDLRKIASKRRGLGIRFSENRVQFVADRYLKAAGKYPSPLKNHPSLHVFFFGDDESENLNAGITFLDDLGNRVGEGCRVDKAGCFCTEQVGSENLCVVLPRFHVYIACSGRSDELLLDSVESIAEKGIDVRVVDEGREVIYSLIWEHPFTETLDAGYRSEEKRNELFEVAKIWNPEKLAYLNESGSGEEATESASSESQESEESEFKNPLEEPVNVGGRECGLASIAVVIIGMGHYGFEAFRAACWAAQIPGTRLNIYAIDQRPTRDIVDKTSFYCPGLLPGGFALGEEASSNKVTRCRTMMADITFCQCDVMSSSFKSYLDEIGGELSSLGTSPYCIISLNGEDLNVDTAVLVRRSFYGARGESSTQTSKIFVNVYDQRRHEVIRKLRTREEDDKSNSKRFEFVPFGGMTSIFHERYLVDSDIEALAFNVSAAYWKCFDDGGRVDEEMLYRGHYRYQMNRLSSTTNAISLKVKCWLLGFDVETTACCGKSAKEANGLLERRIEAWTKIEDADNLTQNGELDVLARNEHIRWTAFYFTEGWERGEESYMERLREAGLTGGRHDSHLLLRHPYLCTFDELKDISMRLQKKDTRSNDLTLLKSMPAILSDSLEYTGKVFRVFPIEDVEPAESKSEKARPDAVSV